MDPADLAALTRAIETAIASGFANAASSMGSPPSVPTPAGGTPGTPPGTTPTVPTPPPEAQVETQSTRLMSESVRATQSLSDHIMTMIANGGDISFAVLDQLVKIQNEAGAKLVRDLRRQVGISVRSGESISEAINRTTNLGAKAVGTSIKAFEANMLEFMKFEGLEPDRFLDSLRDFVTELGDTNINLLHQTDEQMMANMAIFKNSMQMSSEDVAELIAVSYAETGEASTAILDDIANQAKVVGDAVGVPFTQMGEGIREVKADMDTFTDITVAGAARIVASLSQMGLSIQTFKGMMQPFRDFDAAATKMGDLSAMFGVQMDAMEMMYLANEDEEQFLHRMREQLLDQGLDVESMSKTRQRALADSLGMGIKEMKMFMSTGQQVSSMEDLRARSQEASTRSQADAMNALNETMVKVQRSSQEIAEALQLQAGIMTGGSVREASAAMSEAVQNSAIAFRQGTDFANIVNEANISLGKFTATAVNKIAQMGSNFFASMFNGFSSEGVSELEAQMTQFDVDAPARVRTSMHTLANEGLRRGISEAGLAAGSWAAATEGLATTLGSDQFDGGTQMQFYLDEIDNFGIALSDQIQLAMIMISDSFDFDNLSKSFAEAKSIVSGGISEINREINSLSEQVSAPNVSVTPQVESSTTTVVQSGNNEEIVKAIGDIIEKFEKSPTEVKVEFDLDDIKDPIIETIKKGFSETELSFILTLAGEQIATALLERDVKSRNGLRFQPRS